MARGVQRERAPDGEVAGNLGARCIIDVLVRALAGRQHQRRPPEFGQVATEAQRALDAAAAPQRREVVRDHQHAAGSRLIHSIVLVVTASRERASENVWSAASDR